jgi:hypothetical protein
LISNTALHMSPPRSSETALTRRSGLWFDPIRVGILNFSLEVKLGRTVALVSAPNILSVMWGR